MKAKVAYDILVAGNGSLAMSVAFALMAADAQLRVAVVGPKRRENSASLAAGAMLGHYGEVTHASLSCPIAKQKFSMAAQASVLWPSWLDSIQRYGGELQPVQPFPFAGTFIANLNRDDPIETSNFDAIRQALIEDAEPVSELAACDVPGVNGTACGADSRALFIPSESSIQPESLLAGLDAALQRSTNCAFLDALVTHIDVEDRGFTVTTSDGRQLCAHKLLVATGAGGILASLPNAHKMPTVFSGVGVALEVRAGRANVADVVRTPNRGFSAGFHVVPRGGGSYYIGATNCVMVDSNDADHATSVILLQQLAARYLSQQFANAELLRSFSGWRPVSADLYPLLGATSIDGLFVATGTGRDGLFLSPYIGQAIAQQMLTGHNSLPAVFAPERKLLVTMNREQGVDAAVKHIVSAMMSGGFDSAGLPVSANLADVHNYVVSIYQAAGIERGGVPPELLELYRQGVIRQN